MERMKTLLCRRTRYNFSEPEITLKITSVNEIKDRKNDNNKSYIQPMKFIFSLRIV